MSGLSPEQRAAEEAQLRELANELRELASSTAGAGHEDSIKQFAAQADKYANMIRDAVTPELAAAFVAKAAAKAEQWGQLKDMLTFAAFIEGPDSAAKAKELQDAVMEEVEGKISAVALALRALSGRGKTNVFSSIGKVADEAEACLAKYQAAESTEDKLAIYDEFEQAKPGWLSSMETLQNNVEDGIDMTVDAADSGKCEAVSDKVVFGEACQAIQSSGDWGNFGGGNYGAFGDYVASLGNQYGGGGGGGYCAPAAGVGSGFCAPAAASVTCSEATSSKSKKEESSELKKLKDASQLLAQVKQTSEGDKKSAGNSTTSEAQAKLEAYLTDDKEGFLPTLRKAVTKAKADDQFAGVHEDANKFLEQMELAMAALSPGSSTENLTAAQSGSTNAKKYAFAIQKYDLYVATKKGMPKLSTDNEELSECAKVGVEVAEFLRRKAQGVVMNSVAGLVAAIPTSPEQSSR